jgi:hypothetical protein
LCASQLVKNFVRGGWRRGVGSASPNGRFP